MHRHFLKALAVLLLFCSLGGAESFPQGGMIVHHGQSPMLPWPLSSESAEKAYFDIQHEMQRGQYAKADSLWRNAIFTFSQKPADQLMFLLGLANQLRLRAKFTESIQCYHFCYTNFRPQLKNLPIAHSFLLEGYADLALEFSQTQLREGGIAACTKAFHMLPDGSIRKGVLARKLAILFRLRGDREQAKIWLDQAKSLDLGPCEETARLLNEIGYAAFKSSEMELAWTYFDSAHILMNHCPELLKDDWIRYHYQMAEYWAGQDTSTILNLEEEEKACNAGIAIGNQSPEICSNLLNACYGRLALHKFSLGDIAGSIPYAQRSLKGHLERAVSRRQISQAYANLADSYHYLGRFDDALKYYFQAWIWFPRSESNDNGIYITRLANYAQELITNKKYALGDSLMKKAIQGFVASKPNDYTRLAKQYENLGISYLFQKQTEKSIESLLAAVEIYGKASTVSWHDRCYARVHLAMALSSIDKAKEAESQLLISLDEFGKISTHSPMERAMVLEVITEYYIEQGNFDAALEINHRFLQEMIGRSASVNPLETPNLDLSVSPWHTLTAASQKASILWNLYQQNHDLSHLQASLHSCQMALTRLRKLRQEHNNEQEKLRINQHWKTLFENAMRAAMELHHQTQDSCHLHTAFEIAEQSKAMLLMEAVLDNRVLESDTASTALVERRQYVQTRIMRLREAISANSNRPNRLASLYSELFSAEKDLERIMDQIKTANPKYSQLVNGFDVVTVAELQPRLRREQRALVEYFYSDSAIYTLVVTPDVFTIHTYIPDKAFTDSLFSFTRSLQRGPKNNDDREVRQYAAQSKLILNAIWRPIAHLLPRRVTVIPDGPLSFISFEALADSIPEKERLKFKDFGYLLDRYTISYNYSGTFLAQQDRPPTTTVNSVLAMAPSFGETAEVIPLEASIAGVSRLEKEYLHVVALTEDRATKTTFLAEAPNYEILDLATHSKFDRSNFLNSRIYFSPEGTDDGHLYLNELYNLDLSTRLAILEACETGLGDYHQGEGVMCMARGFTYAGCNSVLMSLWEVVEGGSTQQIMQDFYAQLADSLPLDMAIAAAKRNFLQAARQGSGNALLKTHPFYWSELVLIGDNAPLPIERKERQGQWAWLGVPAIMLGLLIGIWWKRLFRRGGIKPAIPTINTANSGMEASHTR